MMARLCFSRIKFGRQQLDLEIRNLHLETGRYLVVIDTRSWRLCAIMCMTPNSPDVYKKCIGLPIKKLCINVVRFFFSCFFI